MNNKIFILLMLIFLTILIYSNENIITLNYKFSNNSSLYKINFNSNNLLFNRLFNNYANDTNKKEKLNIFDKPDFSWFREKNRMEKLFIAIGAVTFAVGFGMFLAGIINLFVPFDAVSIDGEYIKSVRYAYIAITSVGGGLMAVGLPFILVGSIKLGLEYKKNKNSTTGSVQ